MNESNRYETDFSHLSIGELRAARIRVMDSLVEARENVKVLARTKGTTSHDLMTAHTDILNKQSTLSKIKYAIQQWEQRNSK